MSIDLTSKTAPNLVISLADARLRKKSAKKIAPKRRCVCIDVDVDPVTGNRKRKAFYGKTLKEAREKPDAYLAAQKKWASLAIWEQTVAQWVETWQNTYASSAGYSMQRIYDNACTKLSVHLDHMHIRDVREVDICAFAQSSKDRGFKSRRVRQ